MMSNLEDEAKRFEQLCEERGGARGFLETILYWLQMGDLVRAKQIAFREWDKTPDAPNIQEYMLHRWFKGQYPRSLQQCDETLSDFDLR